MKKLILTSLAAAVISLCTVSESALAAPKDQVKKPTLTLACSIYTGWMPCYYAKEQGIYKKWGDKYGLNIEVEYMAYGPSIDAYGVGQKDAVLITNMDAMIKAATAGRDSTVVRMGDYSNGNDGVAVKDGLKCEQLKGQHVVLIKGTVNEFVLSRMLEGCGLKYSDIIPELVDDEGDVAPTFLSNPDFKAVVAWNPILMQILQNRGITKIYDSSMIPGEIQDLTVVDTKVLSQYPDFGRALEGAWDEVMTIMSQRGKPADKAIARMADLSGATVNEFKAQLKTTALYIKPATAAEYTKSDELKLKNEQVRQISFAQGMFGDAKSVDDFGIQYPDGSVQGNPNNIKLRYVDTYMQESADGKLK